MKLHFEATKQLTPRGGMVWEDRAEQVSEVCQTHCWFEEAADGRKEGWVYAVHVGSIAARGETNS